MQKKPAKTRKPLKTESPFVAETNAQAAKMRRYAERSIAQILAAYGTARIEMAALRDQSRTITDETPRAARAELQSRAAVADAQWWAHLAAVDTIAEILAAGAAEREAISVSAYAEGRRSERRRAERDAAKGAP